jgi:hypothetical protein
VDRSSAIWIKHPIAVEIQYNIEWYSKQFVIMGTQQDCWSSRLDNRVRCPLVYLATLTEAQATKEQHQQEKESVDK